MSIELIIIVSLLLSAFFSGIEIAFISSNQLIIEMGKKQGRMTDTILSWLNQRKGTFIAAMLVGNNIALVAYAYYMAEILDKPLLSIWSNIIFVLLAQTLISSVIVLFVAEFLPKKLFRINPNRTLRLFILPILLLTAVLYIPAVLISLLSSFIIKIFSKDGEEEKQHVFGKIDLDNYVAEMNKKTDNEEFENEVQIFQNALDFGKTKARDMMIPRNEVIAMDIEEEIEDLKKNFITTGLSKILIYRDQIDNIIGYVHNKELFKMPESIKSILMPLTIIPESKGASDILKQFIQQKQNIAVVVDEFGGTAGILTIEDVVEEIFGEIQDEHDVEELIEQQINENTYLFSARQEIDVLVDKYDIPIEESSEYETLAGYILHHSQDIPEKEEVIEIEGLTVEIVDVSNNKIELVKLILHKN